MKKQSLCAVILLVLSVILAVVSLIVLPDTVITQVAVGGTDPTTMSKPAAVALPTLLGVAFAVASLAAKPENPMRPKYLFISAVGVLVFILMLVFNR